MHLRFDDPTANVGIEMRVGCWEVGGKCGRGEEAGNLTDSVVFELGGGNKKVEGSTKCWMGAVKPKKKITSSPSSHLVAVLKQIQMNS